VPAASVIATAKLKAVRITVSRSCLELFQAIHPEFNLLSQRSAKNRSNYRLFAAKMVNAAIGSAPQFIAFRRLRPYFTCPGDLPMTRTSATTPAPALTRPFLLLGAAGGALALVALALWGWYGTTVFFEMLRAGFAACF
jgi:hypothetical protein